MNQLVIGWDTNTELVSKLKDLLALLCPSESKSTVSVVEEPEAVEMTASGVTSRAKGKKASKPSVAAVVKEAALKEEPSVVKEEQKVVVAQQGQPTQPEVFKFIQNYWRTKQKELGVKGGDEHVFGILKSLGVERFKELPQEKYGELLSLCV